MVKLREATLKDLTILKYWDTLPHIIAADPDDDWDWEKELKRNPDWRLQLIAELEGQPIGVIQIIDPEREETQYWGNDIGPNKRAIDIWIGDVDKLGKGYGTEMMNQALGICFKNTFVDEVLIDPLESNFRAIKFYRRLGFKFLKRTKLEKQWCMVYSISRNGWINTKELLPTYPFSI